MNSFIRGYHEYEADWEPLLGDIYKLMREPTNEKVVNAVICRFETKAGQVQRGVGLHPNMLNEEFEVTGHVPTLMATWLTRFLKRQTNQGRLVIKEKRVDRRGDFGLKVPCEYIFEGDNLFCEWLHRKDRGEIYCRALSRSTCVNTDSICIFERPHALVGGHL